MNMNILVIEDNSIAAAYLKHKFQHLKTVFPNVRVELALSLKSADNILKNFKPDLITLDLTLEGKEDSDYVKSRLPQLAALCPVIIITMADLDLWSTQELLQLGADSVLEKDTMSSQTFMNAVLAVCMRSAPEQATQPPPLANPESIVHD